MRVCLQALHERSQHVGQTLVATLRQATLPCDKTLGLDALTRVSLRIAVTAGLTIVIWHQERSPTIAPSATRKIQSRFTDPTVLCAHPARAVACKRYMDETSTVGRKLTTPTPDRYLLNRDVFSPKGTSASPTWDELLTPLTFLRVL